MTNAPNASQKKKKGGVASKISVTLPEPIGKAKYPKKTPAIPLTEEGYELLSSEASKRGYDFTPFLTHILEGVAKDIKKMREEQEDDHDISDEEDREYDPNQVTQQAEL